MITQSILCALGVGLVSCGPGGPSFDELCDQTANSVCDEEIACGIEWIDDRTGCVNSTKSRFCPAGEAAYCGTGKTYDPSRGQACSDALKNLTCAIVETTGRPKACTPTALCTGA